MNAEFTYTWYIDLIKRLKSEYLICSYEDDFTKYKKCAILRHDVDYSVEKAVEMARLESKYDVSSTYFFLLTSELYNIFSKKSRESIQEIKSMGHKIGLHFDECAYEMAEATDLERLVRAEIEAMENDLDITINCVSMHRPSRKTLDSDYQWDGLINSYGQTFFHEFKYLSDSRRQWREDVEGIIEAGQYERLHILTHPFWYADNNRSLKESVLSYINSGSKERYHIMKENIRDIESIINVEEVLK